MPSWTMRRRRDAVISLLVPCLVFAACSTGHKSEASKPTSTTSSTTTSVPTPQTTSSADVNTPLPTLVYRGPGIVLVGISPVGSGSQGTKPGGLYLSSDLAHWKDVTPPQSQDVPDPSNAIYPFFEQASFISPYIGWVTAWNPATLGVTIYRTSDGARTWTAIDGLSHGEHAGSALLIDLITPTTAFSEQFDPAAPEMSLSVTRNSGETWKTVYTGPPPGTGDGGPLAGPDEMPFTFTNSLEGFSAVGIPPQAAMPAVGEADFFYTSDGGSTWQRQSAPLPTDGLRCPTTPDSESTVSCEYSVPVFFNTQDGILVGAVTSGLTGYLSFDVTTDGGRHWITKSQQTATVKPYPSPVLYPGPSFAFPLVAIGSPSTWWILGWNESVVNVDVTTNEGAVWTRTSGQLPPGNPANLVVIDIDHALLTLNNVTVDGTTTSELLSTSDRGQSWTPIKLPRAPS